MVGDNFVAVHCFLVCCQNAYKFMFECLLDLYIYIYIYTIQVK